MPVQGIVVEDDVDVDELVDITDVELEVMDEDVDDEDVVDVVVDVVVVNKGVAAFRMSEPVAVCCRSEEGST